MAESNLGSSSSFSLSLASEDGYFDAWEDRVCYWVLPE